MPEHGADVAVSTPAINDHGSSVSSLSRVAESSSRYE
jgi:hypothetical protein